MKNYKYQIVYQKIIDDIEQGILKKNERIPSIRQLSLQLQISKTTIEKAYCQLVDEGYIDVKEKTGFFVVIQDSIPIQKTKIHYHNEIKKKYRYDLTGSYVDGGTILLDVWKKYLKKATLETTELLSYGSSFGESELLNQLQIYSYNQRGVARSIDSYIVGAGFQDSLSHIINLFDRPLRIGVSKSIFKQAQVVMQDCGVEIININEELSIHELENHQIDMLYINTPSGGYHGTPLKRQQRNELIEYARKNKVYIIEDDHNGELTFNGPVIDALARDDNEYIIYLGSFSKLLLPSIRISYLSLPQGLIQKYKDKNQYYHPVASKLEQIALAKYMADGQLTRHLKRVRKLYAKKGNYLLSQLTMNFKDYQFTMVQTPLKIFMVTSNAKKLYEEALKKDILLMYSDNQISFSFAGIEYLDIDEVIKILKKIWL